MDILKLIALRASILGIFAVICIIIFLIVCICIGLYTKRKMDKSPIIIPAPKYQAKELGEIDTTKPFCYINHSYITENNPTLSLRKHMVFKNKSFISELAKDYNVCMIHRHISDKDMAYDLHHMISFIRCNHLPIKRVVSKCELNLQAVVSTGNLVYFKEA